MFLLIHGKNETSSARGSGTVVLVFSHIGYSNNTLGMIVLLLPYHKLDFEIEMNRDRLKNEMPIGKNRVQASHFDSFMGIANYPLSKESIFLQYKYQMQDLKTYCGTSLGGIQVIAQFINPCIKFNSCYTSPYYNCQWFISYMFSSMLCRLIYERFNKI